MSESQVFGDIEHLCRLIFNNVTPVFEGGDVVRVYDPIYDSNAPQSIKEFTGENGWQKYITADGGLIGKGLATRYERNVRAKPLLERIVNQKNSRGQTPLYLASRFASYDTMKILIDAGAKVNVGTERLEPLDGLLWRQRENRHQDQDDELGKKIKLLVNSGLAL